MVNQFGRVTFLCSRLNVGMQMRQRNFEVIGSGMVKKVLEKLVEKGIISSFCLVNQNRFSVSLKYDLYGVNAFNIIKRISSPSYLSTVKLRALKRSFRDHEFLLSTNEGLLWREEALHKAKGGVLVLYIS